MFQATISRRRSIPTSPKKPHMFSADGSSLSALMNPDPWAASPTARVLEQEQVLRFSAGFGRVEIGDARCWMLDPQPLNELGQGLDPLGLEKAQLALDLFRLAVRSRVIGSRTVIHVRRLGPPHTDSVVVVAHQSDSLTQREVEDLIITGLSLKVRKKLNKRKLELPGGAKVEVDGVSRDEMVLAEAFAHQGPLKGGQFGKVARDTLKLITLRRRRSKARLILAFADPAPAAQVTAGKSWLAEALKTWGVEVVVVKLDQAVRDRLLASQKRQRMVNPTIEKP